MGWEELGIQDPGVVWSGPILDWGVNIIGELYNKTINEIEFYQDDISDLEDSGIWNKKIEEYREWLDYIESVTEDAIKNIDPKIDLIVARTELAKFSESFCGYMVSIDWCEEEE